MSSAVLFKSICLFGVVLCVLLACWELFTARHEIRRRNAERKAAKLLERKEEAIKLLLKEPEESARDVAAYLTDLAKVVSRGMPRPDLRLAILAAMRAERRLAIAKERRSEVDAGRVVVCATLLLFDAIDDRPASAINRELREFAVELGVRTALIAIANGSEPDTGWDVGISTALSYDNRLGALRK